VSNGNANSECRAQALPSGTVSSRTPVRIRTAWRPDTSRKDDRESEPCFVRIEATGKRADGSDWCFREERPSIPGQCVEFLVPTDEVEGVLSYRAGWWRDGREVDCRFGSVRVLACETTALPWFQTLWIEPLGFMEDGVPFPPDRMETLLRAYRKLGVENLVLTYVEMIYIGIGAIYPTGIPELQLHANPFPYDFVDTLLAAADACALNVFVGLGRGDDLQLLWEGLDDPDRIRRQVDYGRTLAGELWSRYAHHDSFYGWYLAHEADDLPRANRYYNPMASHLHALAPEKPVLIAPAGNPVVSPAILAETEADILAYQDAVGSGYMPNVNTWNQENRIAMLHECYRRYREAHVGARQAIWTDLEIWKMDGPFYRDAYAADCRQVLRQIEIERPYVQHLSAYAAPAFLLPEGMDGIRPVRGALDLFREYEAHVQRLTEGNGPYPDTGGSKAT